MRTDNEIPYSDHLDLLKADDELLEVSVIVASLQERLATIAATDAPEAYECADAADRVERVWELLESAFPDRLKDSIAQWRRSEEAEDEGKGNPFEW